MPEYNTPPGSDILRDLVKRTKQLEREVALLRNKGGVVMSRGPHTSIPNPYEGQTMIGMDNIPYFYGEGAWHPMGGGAFGGTTSAYASRGAWSHAWTGRDPVSFDRFWTNDDTVFGYSDTITDPRWGSPYSALTYITSTSPGLYLAKVGCFYTSAWTSTTWVEGMTDYGSGRDSLTNFYTIWESSQSVHSQAHSDAPTYPRFIWQDYEFIFDPDNGSDPATLKVGLDIVELDTGTKTYGGVIALHRLGDVPTLTDLHT